MLILFFKLMLCLRSIFPVTLPLNSLNSRLLLISLNHSLYYCFFAALSLLGCPLRFGWTLNFRHRFPGPSRRWLTRARSLSCIVLCYYFFHTILSFLAVILLIVRARTQIVCLCGHSRFGVSRFPVFACSIFAWLCSCVCRVSCVWELACFLVVSAPSLCTACCFLLLSLLLLLP